MRLVAHRGDHRYKSVQLLIARHKLRRSFADLDPVANPLDF
jgi:hypothetical protein